MNISKKSGHYKLLSYVLSDWNISKSLCGYFWQVVLMVMAFVLIPSCVLVIPVVIILDMFAYDQSIFTTALMGLGMIFWMLAIFVIIGATGDFLFTTGFPWVKDKWREVFPVDEYITNPAKEPSLVYEFIKAKHEKVCPLLNFQD